MGRSKKFFHTSSMSVRVKKFLFKTAKVRVHINKVKLMETLNVFAVYYLP